MSWDGLPQDVLEAFADFAPRFDWDEVERVSRRELDWWLREPAPFAFTPEGFEGEEKRLRAEAHERHVQWVARIERIREQNRSASKRNALWRERNRARINERFRAWRRANRTEINAKLRASRHANIEAFRAARRAERQANADAVNAYARAYYETNKAKLRAKQNANAKKPERREAANAYHRQWRAALSEEARERELAYNRAYYQANKARIIAQKTAAKRAKRAADKAGSQQAHPVST